MALGYFRHPRGGRLFETERFFLLCETAEFAKQSFDCGSGRLENRLVIPRSFLARTPSQALVAKFEDEIIY